MHTSENKLARLTVDERGEAALALVARLALPRVHVSARRQAHAVAGVDAEHGGARIQLDRTAELCAVIAPDQAERRVVESTGDELAVGGHLAYATVEVALPLDQRLVIHILQAAELAAVVVSAAARRVRRIQARAVTARLVKKRY